MTPGTDYEGISSRYDEERGDWHVPKEELVTRLLLDRPGGISLLDLGCGTGNYLAAQRKHFMALPVRLLGLDPSDGMLRTARSKLGSGMLVRGRAESLPFPDASFDVVFCTLAFHHFDDKPRALDEATRVLKPFGHLKITNLDPWNVRAWWLYRFFPQARATDRRRFWPVPMLVSELEKRGLKVDARIDVAPRPQSALDLLARAELRVTSQLAIMEDDPYREGMARLRSFVEADPHAVIQDEVGWLHLVAQTLVERVG